MVREETTVDDSIWEEHHHAQSGLSSLVLFFRGGRRVGLARLSPLR